MDESLLGREEKSDTPEEKSETVRKPQDMNPLSLLFSDPEVEQEFRNRIWPSFVLNYQLGVLIGVLMSLINIWAYRDLLWRDNKLVGITFSVALLPVVPFAPYLRQAWILVLFIPSCMLIALSANMHFAIVDSGDNIARLYADPNPFIKPGFIEAQIALGQAGVGLYYILFYMCFLLFLAVVGFPFLTTLFLSIVCVTTFSISYFSSVTMIDNVFGNTKTPSLTALIPLLASTVAVILLKYQTEKAIRLSHLATLNVEAMRLQREAELWFAQQDLVSWVCHEIRNPLNGVIGFAEMIQASSTTEAPRCAQHVLQCASYMTQLGDNIRDLTKLEQGTLVLKPETFIAATLLQEVELLVRHRKRSSVELIFRCPSSLELHGDILRWKQLLVNLVANALELTHHGFVRVEVKRVDTTGVSVKVGDTGPGLSEVNRDKIFDRVSSSVVGS
jgi:signal transduction histidine kinase